MKKLIVIIIAAALILSGCSADMTGSTCGADVTGSRYVVHTYVDDKTGVNYFWVNTDSGVSICPRYNADGSLYTE